MSDIVKIFGSAASASSYTTSAAEASKLSALSLHTDIQVSQNELASSNVLNVPAKKLLENDIALYELYKVVFNQLNISDYAAGIAYSAGDLVWHVHDGQLYLLKCIVDNNTLAPDIELDNGRALDSKLKLSGWENQNKYLTIFDYGIERFMQSLAKLKFDEHQQQQDMHPLGKVSLDQSSSSYIGNTLLKRDMSNIDQSRTTNFFPQHVHKLDATASVFDGYMRDYGHVLEYDIVLKLASSTTASDNYIFTSQTGLSANVFKIAYAAADSLKSAVSYNDNMKYFASSESMDIFAPEVSAASQSRIGMSTQMNRNDYVNTYAATIFFPKPFGSRDYMVFASSVLSHTNGNEDAAGHYELVPSANDIVVCNKTRDSLTLLDIVFSSNEQLAEGEKAKRGGLAANSFHCKIIGTTGA